MRKDIRYDVQMKTVQQKLSLKILVYIPYEKQPFNADKRATKRKVIYFNEHLVACTNQFETPIFLVLE